MSDDDDDASPQQYRAAHGFTALAMESSGEGEGDDNDDDAVTKPVVRPSSSTKKKKKKKKPAAKASSAADADDSSDAALDELVAQAAALNPAQRAPSLAPPSLSFDPAHLDPDSEVKRKLGVSMGGGAKAKKRFFTQGDGWPAPPSFGESPRGRARWCARGR